ncbi:MAG: gamma-glutamyltransferase [Proteobacteria bacterium]|nr:gamma-glutamyltransferase [Pseudomonadota bacterium]
MMNAAFTSHRPVVMGTNWMITSGHPLASQAGAAILDKGGNALDAAIAANAVLGVVRPHMCGIGGDAFIILYVANEKAVKVLNASGRSPYGAERNFFVDKGMKKLPGKGILTATVPGAVDGWVTALEAYGTMPLDTLLQRAIGYAEGGFPVYRELSDVITSESPLLKSCPASAEIFLPNGKAPKTGELLVQRDLAESLKRIAAGGRDAFYREEIGRALVKCSGENEGLFAERDLEDCRSTWVEPIETTYKGHRICVVPPNSQGIALLMQANIIENFDLAKLGHNSTDYIHHFVEAKKLVFADRDTYVCDPDFHHIPVEKMLSKDYARERMSRIDPNRAALNVSPTQFSSRGEDTIYLAVVDGEGNAVSMINSLYEAFGSGTVVEGTGIMLHNRGKDFSLNPAHVNAIEPHKRPYHTLSPCMVLRGERPSLVLGSPGADGQTQTLLQVIANIIDFKADVQGAIESSRWRSNPGNNLLVEGRFPTAVVEGLKAKGHQIEVLPDWSAVCGGAQGIIIDREEGVLLGGADPRRQAYAIGC